MHLERSLTQSPALGHGNLVRPASQTVIELRSCRGWTQEKLAEKSILSVRTIQNLERGKSTHLGTIAKVADALGVAARDCIASLPPGPGRSIKASIASVAGELPPCPYKGLMAFTEEDADVFFGREMLVEVLKEKLATRNIVQVSGPSGSGKSSLVSAGLISVLRPSWQVIQCRPGADPFGSLASALIPYIEPNRDEIYRAAQIPKLRQVLEDGQLCYLLGQILLTHANKGLLLFVDQFEEIFTQCGAHGVRNRFLDSVLPIAFAGMPGRESGLKFIYTIRADFAHRLLSHRRFTDAIQDGDVKIGPMNREELDSVIQRPASLRHVTFEDGLAERILNDAGAEPGTLPLLEFALTELWIRQTEHTLTHTAYSQIGQLYGAIAQRAEKVYRSLTPLQQEAARHILIRLVHLGDERGEDTRQRIPVSGLYSEELLNKDSGRRVLAVLTESRLVTVGIGSDRQQEVEIAHEALVRRWPRLSQWLQEDRDILVWRQRLHLIIREWQQTGRDEGFLLRGSLLDEARLWLSRRATDLTPREKAFISSSLAFNNRERSNRPIERLELLVDTSGGEFDGRDALVGDLPFLKQPEMWRLQINVIPVPSGNRQVMRAQLPQLPIASLLPLFATAAHAEIADNDENDLRQGLNTAQEPDDQTFALVRSLQLRGASGLALELLNPQLDGISDPNVRLKFASIVFDMMHVRGRYLDAAELIQQELLLHPENGEGHSPLLLALKIRLIHHQMFYTPVTELWSQMVDLLACCDRIRDHEAYGEVLFMLGGNLGALRGDYRVARQFLVRAARHARQRNDQYLLTRCLRKYGDILRHRGHLQLSKAALVEALRLSARGQGTRQRIYVLGCLGDLERQKQNYSAASEYFETAIELARSTFIPGWLGNLHLGLAEVALDRKLFDDAKVLLEQAEAHYRNTRPRHWWGEIQVGLGRSRLMRVAGESGWSDVARSVYREATTAGYANEATIASTLLSGNPHFRNVLMFL